MEDLKTVEGAQEGISSRPLGALALVGAWSEAEEKELDAVLEEVYAAR